MLSEFLLRPVAVALHARALTSPQVRASDDPTARSGSPDALRVLLLGSGVTSGWGVHTHGLALVGSLQRALQHRLKRPVDVEQVSAVGATMSSATELLGNRATEEWDAIVVAFGLSDAMRLTSAREWAQSLNRLLAKLDGDMPRGMLVPVIVVGVAPTDSLGLMTPIRSIFRRQPERLNTLTQQVVGRNRRTVFAPLLPMANSAERPQGSPEAYRAWAEAIAEQVILVLPRDVDRVGDPTTAAYPIGGLTTAALAPGNAAVRETLQQIARRVRTATDADLVLINLLNGDRLWSVADSVAGNARSVPLSGTFCATTLRNGFLHVPDAIRDPRFTHLLEAGRPHFNSYAGIALHDGRGSAVGTLCVFEGSATGDFDEAMLRSVGHEVEGHLTRLPATGHAEQRVAQTAPVLAAADVSAWPQAPAASRPEPAAVTGVLAVVQSVSVAAPGALGRRARLSTEGRQLTKSGANRPSPAARDMRIQGSDPIRVLLVGGEYAVGFGTTDRADALDGAIARLLHTRTGRGVIVENRSRHLVSLEQLSGSLGPAGGHTFDLVVWTPTFVEAARLLLRSRWMTGISLMLRKIQTTSDAGVLLMGFPSLQGAQPLAVVGRTRAAQINRLLTRIASRHHRVLVAEPPAIVLGDVDSVDGPTVYRAAAVALLPAMMQLLSDADGSRTSSHATSEALQPELLATG